MSRPETHFTQRQFGPRLEALRKEARAHNVRQLRDALRQLGVERLEARFPAGREEAVSDLELLGPGGARVEMPAGEGAFALRQVFVDDSANPQHCLLAHESKVDLETLIQRVAAEQLKGFQGLPRGLGRLEIPVEGPLQRYPAVAAIGASSVRHYQGYFRRAERSDRENPEQMASFEAKLARAEARARRINRETVVAFLGDIFADRVSLELETTDEPALRVSEPVFRYEGRRMGQPQHHLGFLSVWSEIEGDVATLRTELQAVPANDLVATVALDLLKEAHPEHAGWAAWTGEVVIRADGTTEAQVLDVTPAADPALHDTPAP